MKTAISTMEKSLDSKLDQRFGRCGFFAIFDDTSGTTDFIENPNKESREGAGPATVQLVASHGVNKVVSGEFGIKIKPLLDSLNIQMIIIKDTEVTVAEIIEKLSK